MKDRFEQTDSIEILLSGNLELTNDFIDPNPLALNLPLEPSSDEDLEESESEESDDSEEELEDDEEDSELEDDEDDEDLEDDDDSEY